MSPNDFIEARSNSVPQLIYNRPYLPNVMVTTTDPASILEAVKLIVFYNETIPSDLTNILHVKLLTGGITNVLYLVKGFSLLNKPFDKILVRVFGAPGMIDRDVETYTFAALAERKIAPPYLGRFGNGRLEGFYEDFSTLSLKDFQVKEISEQIAVQMARLHFGFIVPDELKRWHNSSEPGLWSQLFSWMDQAQKIEKYKTGGDDLRAQKLFDLSKLSDELNWVKRDVVPVDAKVVFCHNDLLAANIMKDDINGSIKLIDFEYGGVNYLAFDIANHLNEHAGGTTVSENGVPNYDLFPSIERQNEFVTAYINAAKEILQSSDGIENEERIVSESLSTDSLLKEVEAFILVNHLYWGLWAVNQAATEGTEGFDYLTYASNRFKRYNECKRNYG